MQKVDVGQETEVGGPGSMSAGGDHVSGLAAADAAVAPSRKLTGAIRATTSATIPAERQTRAGGPTKVVKPVMSVSFGSTDPQLDGRALFCLRPRSEG